MHTTASPHMHRERRNLHRTLPRIHTRALSLEPVSAHASLQALDFGYLSMGVNGSPVDDQLAYAYGAFSPVGCAESALRHIVRGEEDWEGDRYGAGDHDSSSEDEDDVPRTPPSSTDSPGSISIPTITRSTSPSSTNTFEIPPPWGPQSKRIRRARRGSYSKSTTMQTPKPSPTPTPRAVLLALERRSRVSSGPLVCANCEKCGMNFPSCKLCGGTWCSRACREEAQHRCRRAG